LELAITLVVFIAGAAVAAAVFVLVVVLLPLEFEQAAKPADRSAAPTRMPIPRCMPLPSALDILRSR
jgi:hypothetical protein